MYANGCCILAQPGPPTVFALIFISRSCCLEGESPEFPYQACSQTWVLSVLSGASDQPGMPTHGFSSHWWVLQFSPVGHGPQPVLTLVIGSRWCSLAWPGGNPGPDNVLPIGSCGLHSRGFPQVILPGQLPSLDLMCAGRCPDPAWHGLLSVPAFVCAGE